MELNTEDVSAFLKIAHGQLNTAEIQNEILFRLRDLKLIKVDEYNKIEITNYGIDLSNILININHK